MFCIHQLLQSSTVCSIHAHIHILVQCSTDVFLLLMQIAGVTEVKAAIKLQLRTAQGDPLLIYRAFQLTQQKSKKQFKSLDGTIETQDPNTGENAAVSKKCADMDKMVPSLMGVSKPVLEHVVFVHQEDSLWPLSESKPLKERFDAIFAATKYNTAVQKMRDLVKEKAQVLFCLSPFACHHSTCTNEHEFICWQLCTTVVFIARACACMCMHMWQSVACTCRSI